MSGKSHFLCQLESDIQNQDKSSVLIFFFFFTSVEHHMKGNSNYELKNTDQQDCECVPFCRFLCHVCVLLLFVCLFFLLHIILCVHKLKKNRFLSFSSPVTLNHYFFYLSDMSAKGSTGLEGNAITQWNRLGRTRVSSSACTNAILTPMYGRCWFVFLLVGAIDAALPLSKLWLQSTKKRKKGETFCIDDCGAFKPAVIDFERSNSLTVQTRMLLRTHTQQAHLILTQSEQNAARLL